MVKLVEEKSDASELQTSIASAAAIKVQGSAKHYNVTVIDAKLMCESGSQAK